MNWSCFSEQKLISISVSCQGLRSPSVFDIVYSGGRGSLLLNNHFTGIWQSFFIFRVRLDGLFSKSLSNWTIGLSTFTIGFDPVHITLNTTGLGLSFISHTILSLYTLASSRIHQTFKLWVSSIFKFIDSGSKINGDFIVFGSLLTKKLSRQNLTLRSYFLLFEILNSL